MAKLVVLYSEWENMVGVLLVARYVRLEEVQISFLGTPPQLLNLRLA